MKRLLRVLDFKVKEAENKYLRDLRGNERAKSHADQKSLDSFLDAMDILFEKQTVKEDD